MAKRRWDEHHVLFQRRSWQRDPSGRVLRSDHGLIVPMDISIHRELHRDKELWQGVPILGRSAMRMVRDIYEPQSDHIRSVEKLLSAINRTSDPSKELALHAIEAEIPYLVDGQWLLEE